MPYAGLVGTGTVTTSGTAGAATVTTPVSAGRTVAGAIVWDSSSGTIPTISSVVDTRGNTWTADVTAGGAGNTTVAVGIFRARVTTALLAGDTITVTIGAARARWAMQYDQFDDLLPSALDVGASNSNPGSATSLVTGATLDTGQPYELAYAAFGMGAGRVITIPPDWSGTASVETAAGSADRALQVIYQYSSTAGAQQGTLTLGTASTYTAAIATYRAWVPPGRRVVRAGAASRAATR